MSDEMYCLRAPYLLKFSVKFNFCRINTPMYVFRENHI